MSSFIRLSVPLLPMRCSFVPLVTACFARPSQQPLFRKADRSRVPGTKIPRVPLTTRKVRMKRKRPPLRTRSARRIKTQRHPRLRKTERTRKKNPKQPATASLRASPRSLKATVNPSPRLPMRMLKTKMLPTRRRKVAPRKRPRCTRELMYPRKMTWRKSKPSRPTTRPQLLLTAPTVPTKREKIKEKCAAFAYNLGIGRRWDSASSSAVRFGSLRNATFVYDCPFRTYMFTSVLRWATPLAVSLF
ncbi:hypothetical protein HDK77DRAFT_155840 [Phyllosticta capitalensis]|uniref:Uncharacterized protein n=1 Tax=Phyllosticta capitalensis TaxID=121624 RepID=A0ABR1YTC3_9PEZI